MMMAAEVADSDRESEDVSASVTAPTVVHGHRAKLLGAFFLIYIVWGSNFLAIRYAVETVPPFLLMGVRSLLAGFCLYSWARLRGAGPRFRWPPES